MVQELNDERRKASLKDRLLNETLNSFFRNAVNLGTGMVFILAAQAMQQGTFTVGDFALFVYYLDHITRLIAFSGELIALYRQIGVSVERMGRLMEGAPPEALTESSPVYMDGKFPKATTGTGSKSGGSLSAKRVHSNLGAQVGAWSTVTREGQQLETAALLIRMWRFALPGDR